MVTSENRIGSEKNPQQSSSIPLDLLTFPEFWCFPPRRNTYFYRMNKIAYLLLLTLNGYFLSSCNEPEEEKKEVKTEKKEKVEDKDSLDDARLLEEINAKIRKDPNNPNFYNERSYYYFKRAKMEEALLDIDRCIKIDSTVADLYISKGNIYFAQLKAEEARNQYEKAKSVEPLQYKADLKLAQLYLYIRNYKKSMEYTNSALKLDKHVAEGYFIKGSIYEEMRDSANAASSFQTAIEQDPNYYDAYIRLGILYSKLPKKNKKRALAYDYFNSAIEIRPDFIEGHYDKAMFCQENDLLDEALEEYEKIIAIDPKFESAWHNKGYVYLIYKQDFKLAVDYFTKAIEIKPNYVGAYHNRALAWLKLGDLQRARADFNAALQIDPQYDKAAIELDNLDKGKVN